jgi:hypothetical protein
MISYELSADAIEEGRIALLSPENDSPKRGYGNHNDAVSEASSKHHSSTNERRMLDQMPRVTRLNNRQESLGLTVEVCLFFALFLLRGNHQL